MPRIATRDLTLSALQRAAIAVGEATPYLDDSRNVRPATMDELEEFCFGPLRKLVREREERLAKAAVIAAANISVRAFDDPEQ